MKQVIFLGVGMYALLAVRSEAGDTPSKTQDAQRRQKEQAGGRAQDRQCVDRLGAGAFWSRTINACIPPKPTTSKEAVRGQSGPKGGAAPRSAEAAKARVVGRGESCAFSRALNARPSCKAPYTCVKDLCDLPARSAKATEGLACGPSAGGAFIQCAEGLKCDPSTKSCAKAAAAKAPEKKVEKPAGAARKAGEGRLCGNVKNSSGQVERVECQEGLACKPSTKVAGLGSCAKKEPKAAGGIGVGERCGTWWSGGQDVTKPCGAGLSCRSGGRDLSPENMKESSGSCHRRCAEEDGYNGCFGGWTTNKPE